MSQWGLHLFVCIQILTYVTGLKMLPSSPQQKLYDQLCISDHDCDRDHGLSCHNKVCKCDSNGLTVFSLAKNRCVGAAGRECIKVKNETFCVPNSVCQDYGYVHLCTCKEGFYQSKDGNCYPIAKYGDLCLEEDFSCGDTMSTSISCVEKQCHCVLGEENQYYDSKENRCTSFAGGQCIPHYYQPCPPNSVCGEVSEMIGGASFMAGHKCICSPGYSYSRNRQCLARYGTSCGSNNPCNYDEFLGCLNGVCQCRNPLNEVFNPRLHQCTILVGSNCNLNSTQKCVDNAHCVPEKINTNGNSSSSSPSKYGKCQCDPGYSVTPVNTCLLDINQKCGGGGAGQDCNFYNALTCINGTCNCIDSYLSYDKVSKSCVSLVGLPCGTVSLLNEGQEKEVVVLCEANALCSKVYGLGAYYNGAAKRICKPASAKP